LSSPGHWQTSPGHWQIPIEIYIIEIKSSSSVKTK
jgi:hypothetical protein